MKKLLSFIVLTAAMAACAQAACTTCAAKLTTQEAGPAISLGKDVKINDTPANVVFKKTKAAPEKKQPAPSCGERAQAQKTWYYRDMNGKDLLENLDTIYQGQSVQVEDSGKALVPPGTKASEAKPIKTINQGEPLEKPAEQKLLPPQLKNLGVRKHALESQDLADMQRITFSNISQ